MKFQEKIKDGILYLGIEGDLIGENSGPELMEKANDHVLNGITLCAIDISQVRYINSSGLGVFIALLTKFRNEGGEVVLINPSDKVKQTLLITKLTSIFTIVADETEAADNLKQAQA
ncbi:MAG TPA: anti-anti-sigma factor [Cytophagales bacterium]|nr:anti-anti-sigma factor [Cytophagales bacterium]HAA18788.1 anti-anti-sigma factor [Cytophagales bacterium]HAP64266.1 anti-anti-sigma factor [Cytophagales bacterium]